jgi:hypothetical protein
MKEEQINFKSTVRIIFLLALLLFAYATYRALVLSITWDEAYSYLQFVRNEIIVPDKYEQMDANNHILNTWMNIQLTRCFGVSEFVLRIPSLFAHLIFLFFSYKLVRGFQSSWLIIASFLILNINPYVLDFFSLSRGYAMSLGLMMGSIYFLYAFIKDGYKAKHALVSSIFGALATTANFVVLNYFIVSYGLIFLMSGHQLLKADKTLTQKTVQLFAKMILPTLVVFISLFLLLPIAIKLKEAGALFYGGNKGFWTDTFCSITDRSFYELGYNYWFQRFAKGFVILVAFAGSVFVGWKQATKKTNEHNLFLGALLLLLGLCSLSTIVQHYLFETLYLLDRTAMFLVILFNLTLVFFINELCKENKKSAIVSYLACLFLVYHFVLSFNLNYVLEWKSNADVKEMLTDLEKIKSIPKQKKSINICTPLSFVQSINYYRAVNNITWINTVERSEDINLLSDYLYLEPKQYAGKNMDSLEIINVYPLTKNILAKPKFPPDYSRIRFSEKLNFENTEGEKYVIDEKVEYAQGFNYTVNDSITPDRNGEVVFSAEIMAESILKSNLYVIISFENANGLYEWKRAFIKDYIVRNNEWMVVRFSVPVPKNCLLGDQLKCYIWNPNKHKLFVKQMELKWLSKP